MPSHELLAGVCRPLGSWAIEDAECPRSLASPQPFGVWVPCLLVSLLAPLEQHVLAELERQAVLVYTPSRKVQGKRVVCYDDRYIVKVAFEQDGVIVSNDNYRDLQRENPEWKRFIEQRLLMFSFVNDRWVQARGAGRACRTRSRA